MSESFPVLWFHIGFRGKSQLFSVLEDQLKNGRSIGVVAGPHGSRRTDFKAFQTGRAKAPTFFDPHGHFIDRNETSARRRKHYPCIDEDTVKLDDPSDYPIWMNDCITVQESEELRGKGPRPVLVSTPSRLVAETDVSSILYPQIDAASVAAVEPPGSKWIGVSLGDRALKDEKVRTRVANRLVEIPVQSRAGIALRLFHPPYLPIDNGKFLGAAKELVEGLSDQGIPVFMLSSGWFGWLATGWGADAFSAGMSQYQTWNNSLDGAPPKTTKKSRNYFEPRLLRPIDWPVHTALASRDGYHRCPCPYCKKMGKSWDRGLAMQHQLWWASREARRLEGKTRIERRSVIADRLRDAIKYRNGFDQTLREETKAGFLDNWLKYA